MKKLVVFYVLSFVLLKANGQYKVEQAFSLKETPADIEGLTYDPVDGNFYFGESISHKLLRYSKTGKALGSIDAAKDGMTSVLGMKVVASTHQLWACGAITQNSGKVMCVFQYDLNSGNLLNKYADTSGKAQLFNDITITANGGVYITDTYTKSLYTIDTANKIAVLYLQSDSGRDGNGICAVDNILYVSTSRGITSVNTTDKKITLVPLDQFVIAGIDGLYYYNYSFIGIQNVLFPIVIGRYYLDKEGLKIERGEVMAANHSSFGIPTTGAIAADYFYFMSNTNIGDSNDKSKKITVARIRLTP